MPGGIVGAKGVAPSPVPASTAKPSYSLKVIKINCGDAATNRPFIPLMKDKETSILSEWTDGTDEKAIWGFVCKPPTEEFIINAQFEFRDRNGNNVPVQGSMSVTVGTVSIVSKSNEVTVARGGGGNKTGIKQFKFKSPNIRGFSKQVVSFTFKYKDIANKWATAKAVPIIVYFIPYAPTKPWKIDINNDKQNPWTDALDMLLDGWGVIGLEDSIKIATQITRYIFNSIKFKYDILRFNAAGAIIGGGGATKLSTGSTFHCSTFISDVKRKRSIIGNCSDCATLVSTFSNLLGSNLSRKRFGTGGFYCNKIKTIGYSNVWQYPFPRDSADRDVVDVSDTTNAVKGGFRYHEIVFDGSGAHTDKIYDACLKVNENILQGTSKEKLPANTQFAGRADGEYNSSSKSLGPDSSIKYREMLVLDDNTNSLNNASITLMPGWGDLD